MNLTPFTISFVIPCLFMADVAAANWFRRDIHIRDDVFVPQRVDIPVSFDKDGRYVATASLGNQDFNITFTTGTGLSYVAAAGCSGCEGVSMYNQSASPSARTIGPANVSFFNSTMNASLIKENCTMQISNGSTWPYPNQTFVVMNQESTNILQQASNAVVGNEIPGFLGLGTNRGPALNGSNLYKPTFQDSIFGQWLSVHPTALNFTFGMALQPPIVKPRNASSSDINVSLPTSSNAGTLHWLQTDPSFYHSDQVSWVTVDYSLADSGDSGTDPQDWFVGLDGWVAISGNSQIKTQRKITANVDPLYQGIYIPLDQATLLHDAIPGSYALPTTSTLGSLAQSWSIPCDSQFTFGIIVGSQTFTLDSTVVVVKLEDGTCVSGIEAWTDSNLNQYLLGARLISTFYLIFTIPSNGENAIGIAMRESLHISDSHVGAIVGGTIGGLALVLITIFVVWWFCVRPQPPPSSSASAQEQKRPTTFDIMPYTLVATRSPPDSPNMNIRQNNRASSCISETPTQTVLFASDRSLYTTNPFNTPQSSPSSRGSFAQHQDDKPPPTYDEAARTNGGGEQRRDRKRGRRQ